MSYAPPPINVTGKKIEDLKPWQRWLYLVFPAPCLSCGEPAPPTKTSVGLCEDCTARLLEWPHDACGRCGRLLEAAHLPEGYLCGTCRQSPPVYDRLLCRFSYESPLEEVIVGLKFRRLDYLGPRLGNGMARHFHLELSDIDAVTAVPMHWLRYLQRGYNPAWILAAPLARALGKPLVRMLVRRTLNSPQRTLKRDARRNNLRRAFQARRPRDIQGRHILLVDDVMTTGATLDAAATCLRQSGARAITALTLARTPNEAERRLLTLSLDGRRSELPGERGKNTTPNGKNDTQRSS